LQHLLDRHDALGCWLGLAARHGWRLEVAPVGAVRLVPACGDRGCGRRCATAERIAREAQVAERGLRRLAG
jgi:hypothetical protein